MNYEITYLYKDKQQDIRLADCENIMDCMYKFYEAHGFDCEIISIDKLS
jgi:hypothetical protein